MSCQVPILKRNITNLQNVFHLNNTERVSHTKSIFIFLRYYVKSTGTSFIYNKKRDLFSKTWYYFNNNIKIILEKMFSCIKSLPLA